MKLLFVVRASVDIGMGHLLRCLALAQACALRGFESVFLLDELSKQLAENRTDWVGDINTILDYSCQQLLQTLGNQQGNVDWVVVDGYEFNDNLLITLKREGYRVAVFRDGNCQLTDPADVIIDSSSRLDTQINSQQSANATDKCFLTGDDYRLLRQEFRLQSPVSMALRESLTLSFGGSDPFEFTLPTLQALEARAFNAPINVVLGSANKHVDAIQRFCEQSKLNVRVLVNVQNMAALWSSTRLAVSAAGGSQFELAVCATPAILVVLAENQAKAAAHADSEGWCKVIPFTHQSGFAQIIAEQADALWKQENTLQTMHERVVNKYDAQGADRILDALESVKSIGFKEVS